MLHYKYEVDMYKYKAFFLVFLITFLTSCGGPVSIEGDVYLVKGDGKPQPAAAKDVIFLPINDGVSLEGLLTEIYLEALRDQVEKNDASIKKLCLKSTNIIQENLDEKNDLLINIISAAKLNGITDSDGSCLTLNSKYKSLESAATNQQNYYNDLINAEKAGLGARLAGLDGGRGAAEAPGGDPRRSGRAAGAAGGRTGRCAPGRARMRAGAAHARARVLPMHTLPRLDGDAQVVLEHPREVLLQLGAAVVREDLVPVGRLLGLAQVGLELAREHVERGRLAYAVGPEPGRGRPEGRWKAGGRVGDSGGGHARHRRTAAPPLEAVAPHECGGRPQPLDGAQSVESAPEHARLASCGTSGTPLSAGCRAGRAPSLAAASAGRAA